MIPKYKNPTKSMLQMLKKFLHLIRQTDKTQYIGHKLFFKETDSVTFITHNVLTSCKTRQGNNGPWV